MSKPALLVVNKMDLPDAEDKLQELKEQLQHPDGKTGVVYYSAAHKKRQLVLQLESKGCK